VEVAHLEILVEEPSMEAALRILVPKIASGISFEVHAFQSKQELLGRLEQRLRGYAKWLPSNWRILVVVDRDDDDCKTLKHTLETAAQRAGLRTRTRRHDDWQVVNRLAVEELEAWFFGDWEAVCCAFPRVDPNIPRKTKYRRPEGVRGGTWEALERVLQKAGYFKTGLRKIEAARAIAAHMEPRRNLAHSFKLLCETLEEIADP